MGARRRDREQGIYRRVTVRMWGDAKVMALSRPQPCGQMLWIHLLTGEQTDIIPGLCKIGEAAFAEQLGWTTEGFREAFREVAALGMAKADWTARVVFVPKAIEHNAPASANVVTSWADAWDRIPECPLKLEAWRTLRVFLEGFHKGFVQAFDKSCPKPSAMPSGNQEQDQEQIKALSHACASARETERQTSVPEAAEAAPPPAAEAVSGTEPSEEQLTEEATTDAPAPGKPEAPDVHAGAGETTEPAAAPGAEGVPPAPSAPAPLTPAAARLAAALPPNCGLTLELLRQLEEAEGFLGSLSKDRASRSVVERVIATVTLPVAFERMRALIRADKAAGGVTKPWMIFHVETIEGRKPGQRPSGSAPARRTHGDLGVELEPWWKRLSRADRERFNAERMAIDPKLDGAPYPATGLDHTAEVEALIDRWKASAAAPGAAA